ncbi:MAG: hypothetical protein R3F49_17170 [Planctomycetota bacterium]
MVPPFGLIVRQRSTAERWIALSPNRSVAIFEQASGGDVRCEYRLVPGLGAGSDAESAVLATELADLLLVKPEAQASARDAGRS